MSLILFIAVTLFRYCGGDLNVEPVVELRWDFTDCGQTGRLGPTQDTCDAAYKDTNLENDVILSYGIQTWTAPISGLYLITARGPSGLETKGVEMGKGAVTTADFRLVEGEQLSILVGQRSDYNPASNRNRGPGGSGGTFITRVSDGFLLMVAGGGSSGAGNIPDINKRSFADANFDSNGKNASKISGSYGLGGVDGLGGFRSYLAAQQISSSGGGAGYKGNGNMSFIKPGELLDVRSPLPSVRFSTRGVSDRAPGVGGFFMFVGSNNNIEQNNGGFGGGGAGSFDGGAGGGGGYSGGGGGTWNGWGGGGGSLNNGEKTARATLQRGPGGVTITFTGYSCCGPVVVYIAMCFVAGIIVTLVMAYVIYSMYKCCQNCAAKSGSESGWAKTKKGFYSVFKRRSAAPSKEYEPPRAFEHDTTRSRNRRTYSDSYDDRDYDRSKRPEPRDAY